MKSRLAKANEERQSFRLSSAAGDLSPSARSRSKLEARKAMGLDQYVRGLAACVESRWRAAHYDANAFAAIATNALGEKPANAELEPLDLLRWAARTDPLPPQDSPGNRFGEPAIRLFDNGRFFIQALFWFDSTTSIHQHSFSGAFEVLAGSSIHSLYDFDATERLNEHLQLGKLALTGVELLQRGAVRTIRTGRRFIHSLFHLDHPSVSFLVRTHNDVESGPLYTYAKPGIAFDSFHVTPRTKMLHEVLIAANAMGPKVTTALLREVFLDADAETAFHLLTTYRQLFGFDDWPNLPPQLARLIGARSPSWYETVSAALVEQVRQQRIVDSRKHVTDPELRFCLALLLNTETRRDVFELVAARLGGRDLPSLVAEWIGRLWETTIPGEVGEPTNPLLLACEPHVMRPAVDILSRMLAAETDDDIVRALPDFRGVQEVCALWRGHPFLVPLFSVKR